MRSKLGDRVFANVRARVILPRRCNAPHALKRGIVRTPLMVQADASECGALALWAILGYYGRWVDMGRLRSLCCISRDGTSGRVLLCAARACGMEASAVRIEAHNLQNLPRPSILHWKFAHYVVFEGTDKKHRICINDPAHGRSRHSLEEAKKLFTGVAFLTQPSDDFVIEGMRPSSLGILWDHLASATGQLVWIIALGLVVSVLTLSIPYLLRHAMVTLKPSPDPRFHHILLILLGVMAFRPIAGAIIECEVSRRIFRNTVQSASAYSEKLIAKSYAFFATRNPAELTRRIHHLRAIQIFLLQECVPVTIGLSTSLIAAGLLLQFSFIAMMMALVVAAVQVGLTLILRRHALTDLTRLAKEEETHVSVSAWSVEMAETSKAMSMEANIFQVWASQQARMLNLRAAVDRKDAMIAAIAPLSMVGVLIGGAYLSLASTSGSSGNGVSGLTIQLLLALFFSPLLASLALSKRSAEVMASAALVKDVACDEPTTASATEEVRCACQDHLLCMHDVTFAYTEHSDAVLEDVCLHVSEAEWVAVTGPSGSGKSTLVGLLSGQLKPSCGQVLRRHLIKQVSNPTCEGKDIGVVMQQPTFYPLTIGANIRLWREWISDTDIENACTDACILAEVREAGGFSVPFAAVANRWSHGQLQRLEIARALAGRPKVLILDEPASSLDSSIELVILTNIRKRRCSCILVAHRLSTIRTADRILVLDHGRIVGHGDHDYLMTTNNFYKALYEFR